MSENASKVIVVNGEEWTEQDALNDYNENMPEWAKESTTFADYLNFLYGKYGAKKQK